MGERRGVDARAMGMFLAALKNGRSIATAAAEAGFAASSFYRRREVDAAFGAAWDEAVEIGNAPTFIAAQGNRRLQLRKARRVRFSDARKAVFLARFAGTCDLKGAAEAAGVCADTVNNHRRKDASFAEALQAALEQGFARLEEEAVRARLAAQERLRGGVMPEGEVTAEFERQMKLLAHWTRRSGAPGPRSQAREHLKRWSFEKAIGALERKLRALKIPIVGETEAALCSSSGVGGEAMGPLHQPLAGPPPRPGEDLG